LRDALRLPSHRTELEFLVTGRPSGARSFRY
jgi:hypothetical protein